MLRPTTCKVITYGPWKCLLSGLPLPQVHGSRGVGHLDPFRSKSLPNTFAKLVLHKKLIDELRHLTNKTEFQRRIAKAGDEPHEGCRLGEQACNRSGRPFHLLQQHALDLVRVAVVADADRDNQ